MERWVEIEMGLFDPRVAKTNHDEQLINSCSSKELLRWRRLGYTVSD